LEVLGFTVIADPQDIIIRTYKNDKYGRIVADLIVEEENINQKMVKVGHAIYRDDWNAGSWVDPLGDG
jgi:endonuclease YncB( thermonuclease family)